MTLPAEETGQMTINTLSLCLFTGERLLDKAEPA